MQATTAEQILKWLLRIMGGMAALAIIAVFMPTTWMEAGADWTGLAPFPDTTLVQYLARSLSLLYAFFGLLVLYIASDVRRYRDLIVFMGWLTILLGIILTGLDLAIGMPLDWIWMEGPPTILTGVAFIWLARRIDRA